MYSFILGLKWSLFVLYIGNRKIFLKHHSFVLYAWMNGYSTLLHNIAPGKYIVNLSRLNMDYSSTSKYFLTNQIEKTTTKIINEMLMILDFKILSL